jgi:2-polyprenyl-3-methyl-5-hydroxy-6-metoxy-1,4-benzoquinol methylase
MYSKESIQTRLEELQSKYGNWTYDVSLPYGIWAKGVIEQPYTRLKRVVQMVSDLSNKPVSECRILDLGCLNGLFSIELAQHGASVVGIEIREANIQKALFCRDVLGLENLEFIKDDVRNISVEKYGRFDVIICSGILYHLPALDAIHLIQTMYQMVDRVVIIDTHTALEPLEKISHSNGTYWGSIYVEHAEDLTQEQKEKSLWASADNNTSFWFTRPSLINILSRAGFSSIHECFNPIHIQHPDRCTLAAIKGIDQRMFNSPQADYLQQEWPEKSLTYAPEQKTLDEIENSIPTRRLLAMVHKRIFMKIKSKFSVFTS